MAGADGDGPLEAGRRGRPEPAGLIRREVAQYLGPSTEREQVRSFIENALTDDPAVAYEAIVEHYLDETGVPLRELLRSYPWLPEAYEQARRDDGIIARPVDEAGDGSPPT